QAGAEPGRGAPAPSRRQARRRLARARHRPLPDAEHARGTDRTADQGVSGCDAIASRSLSLGPAEPDAWARNDSDGIVIARSAATKQSRWGEAGIGAVKTPIWCR